MWLDAAEYALFASLALVLAVGPWSRTIATLFALSEYEDTAAIHMIVRLFRAVPATFLSTSALGFVVVPVGLVGLRRLRPRAAARAQDALLAVGCVVSVATLPLALFWRAPPRDGPNAVGHVFTVDLIQMCAWHFLLCASGDLRPSSVVGGPLLGLCLHLRRRAQARQSSIVGAIFVLYSSIGVLYRAHLASERSDGSLRLTHTVPFDEYDGVELYAIVSVIYGFVVIASSCPAPQGAAEALETAAYLVLLNANVAAAWIASRGVRRRALVEPDGA